MIEMASVCLLCVRQAHHPIQSKYPANRSSASYYSSPNREAPQELVIDTDQSAYQPKSGETGSFGNRP